MRTLSVSAYNRGACGMYRPSIGHLTGYSLHAKISLHTAQACDCVSRFRGGFAHKLQAVPPPAFFYARCASLRGDAHRLPDLPSAQARIDELEAELAALRNALPAPDGAERSALPAPAPERTITPGEADVIEPSRLYIGPQRGPDDPPPRSTAVIEGKAVPPAPTAAEREAKRQAINNDRSAYTQQGLRPAGGEPWRPFVGGSNSGIFWGGRGGRSW